MMQVDGASPATLSSRTSINSAIIMVIVVGTLLSIGGGWYPNAHWIFMTAGLLLTGMAALLLLRMREHREALEKKESRYRTLFEGMTSGVAVYEPWNDGEDFIFRDFNPAGERISKTKRADLIGRKVTEVFPDVKRFGLFEVFQRVNRSGAPEHHPISLYKDDRVAHWVENYVYRLSSGEIVAIYDDVTSQKNAQVALLKSENHLRTLLESLPQKIFLKSPDSVYISCNRHYADDLGIKPEEIAGKTDFDFHPVELAEKYRADDHDVVASGKIKDIEEEYRHDGRKFIIQTVKSPVRNENGNIIGVFGIFWDITQRKRAEERIQDLNVELEQRVSARTAELEAANKALESFLYTVAHDMRAPLRAFDGFSALLLEEYGGRLDDTGRRYLTNLMEGGRDMHDLIEGMLALYRSMKAGRAHEKVDLSAIAREIFAALDGDAPKRSVSIRIEPEISAVGDARLLRTLLVNLFDNAWKFTAPIKDALIEFGITKQDGRTVYQVRDNGVGFDMAHESMLFTPFYQLHKPGEFEGSGVGLALAERIVERHGGAIWAESGVGKGTTLFFTLAAKGKGS